MTKSEIYFVCNPLLPSLLPERSILLFAGASNTTLYILCTFCEYSVYNLYNLYNVCNVQCLRLSSKHFVHFFTLLTVRNVNRALFVQCCRAAPGSHLAHHSGRWLASIRGSLLSQNFKHTASKSRLSVARQGFIFHKTLLTAPGILYKFILCKQKYDSNS